MIAPTDEKKHLTKFMMKIFQWGDTVKPITVWKEEKD